MDSRLQDASRIFLEICDLAESVQRERVGELEDLALRAEVLALLAGDHCENLDLESIPLLAMSDGTYPDPDVAMLDRVGNYTIVRKIGAGSMGVVFEAIQDAPRRSVALKVMASQLAQGSLEDRFKLEEDLLGRLDHPGIASILEAGTFDLGLGAHPFFAMELVTGLPLTTHAREKGLSVEQRIGLLADVCEAVHHAHLRGVIHRDLKPDNILVNEDGKPKILDFGVAHSIEEDPENAEMLTRPGNVIGTLSYMSPEQLGGRQEDLSPASDVFALGVVGYELLSGSLPHDLKGRSLTESIRILEQSAPVRLGSLDRTLSGDIETVIDKCLAKDPLRRYPSAAELVADLHRVLSKHPIKARPPSKWYQVRLFVRRNRVLTIGGAIAMTTLLVASAVIILVALELAQEKHRASATAYRLGVRVAAAEIQKGNSDTAQSILEAAPMELRQWEWNFVHAKLEAWDHLLVADSPISDTLVYSPDGTRLYAALTNGDLVGWDLDTGLCSAPFTIDGKVTAVATNFPPGRALLAAGTEDGSIATWDLSSDAGPIIRRGHSHRVLALTWTRQAGLLSADSKEVLFRTHDDETKRFTPGISEASIRFGAELAASPDGKSVAFCRSFSNTLIRNLETGKLRHYQSPASPRCVVYSDDGATLILGTEFQNLHYLKLHDLSRIDSDSGHTRGTARLRFSPNGKVLAATSFDGTLVLRDAATRRTLSVHCRGKALMGLAYRPDGGQIACADYKHNGITLWNQPMEQSQVISGPRTSVHYLGWSPDGSLLYAGTVRKVCCVIDADTGRRLMHFEDRIPVAFSGDSQRLLVRTPKGLASLDLLTREEVPLSEEGPAAYRVFAAASGIRIGSGQGMSVMSPDCSKKLILGADTRVISSGDGKTLASFPEIQNRNLAASFTQDGRYLLLAYRSARGLMIDTSTWKTFAEIGPAPHAKGIMGMDLSPDGNRLATACHDNTIRLYDVESKDLVFELKGHRSHVACVQFSPDGSRIASSSGDATVRIWDSIPRHERNRRHRSAAQHAAPTRALLDRLFTELGTKKAVAREIRRSKDMTPEHQKAAIDALLRRD